jgi:hypothetical protein
MPLLAGRLLVCGQNLSDDWKNGFDLRRVPRLFRPTTRRFFMAEDLLQGMPTDAKPLCSSTLAQAFDKHLAADYRPKFHENVQSVTSSGRKFAFLTRQPKYVFARHIFDRPIYPARRRPLLSAINLDNHRAKLTVREAFGSQIARLTNYGDLITFELNLTIRCFN